MNITSRQLKAFLLTAEHQSFSRAAEQLYITQSGISVLIRKLEDQLGARLFERTTRRVSLTEFGTLFLPIADRNLLELDVAAASMGRATTEASHRLAIGATPLIAHKLLPTVISEYSTCEPQLEVILQDGDPSQLVAAVLAGEIDMALGSFPLPIAGLRRTPLCQFTLMLIQPRSDAARLARKPRWDDLADLRLLGGPTEYPLQQLIERQLQGIGRRKPPEMRFHNFETHIAMVESGAGAAVLPSYCIPVCREHDVAISPLTDPVVPVDLHQISSRGHKLSPSAEAFTRFLKQHIVKWAETWSPTDERVA